MHTWIQIFDELKTHGIVQRCIVHLIRNPLKYVPKLFTSHLKKIYGAPSLKTAIAEFERFKQVWSKYPRFIDVWKRNFLHVEQLFNY